MISRSSQSMSRFSRLRFLQINRNELPPSRLEGKAILLGTLPSRFNIGFHAQNGLITPISYRTYADRPVSRPKAHTGRTTATRRKKATTVVTGTKAAEKSSSDASKKVTVKKAKTKAKPKPKSKSKASTGKRSKAKSKPKPKPKVKKVLTEKQKDLLTLKKEREKIKELKTAALTPPKRTYLSPWIILVSEKSKGRKDPPNTGNMQSLAQEYRALSPEGVEHYNHLANQEKAAREAAYRDWLHSHTPQQIVIANRARLALKRRGVRGYTAQIVDDRKITGIRNAFLWFCLERHASGDFKRMATKHSAGLIAKEWKALSGDEQQKYRDLAAQDRERYAREVGSVQNHDSPATPATSDSEPVSAAAAASA